MKFQSRILVDEWDRAWSNSPIRLLPTQCPKGVRVDPALGPLVLVEISEAPREFLDRFQFASKICPICGESTTCSPRLAANLSLTFKSAFSHGQIVWAHTDCFAHCPVTGMMAQIPW